MTTGSGELYSLTRESILSYNILSGNVKEQCMQSVNVKVATVLGSMPASSDTVESEERQVKQC
jgi:hypothetical protein